MCVRLCICVYTHGSYGSVSSSSTVPRLSFAAEPRDHQVASGLQGPSSFCATCTKITHSHAEPSYMGAHDLNSDSQACTANISDRAISSTQRKKASSWERTTGWVRGGWKWTLHTQLIRDPVASWHKSHQFLVSMGWNACLSSIIPTWFLKDRKLFLWLNFILEKCSGNTKHTKPTQA